MNHSASLETANQHSVLRWAVERRAAASVSLLARQRWCNFRSQFIAFDSDRNLLRMAYPIAPELDRQVEIARGDQLGISFRRGHKKCIFLAPVVTRRTEAGPDGAVLDVILLEAPTRIRELQRRVYQRVTVPSDRFIAIKIWQGGLPQSGEPSWPLCAGRLGNVSVGGLLVDIRSDQNPRLSVGDSVGVEITHRQGQEPLLAEAQYRHCTVTGPDRTGLGLQFLGLEHALPGRTPIEEIADFVRNLQRGPARQGRSKGR